MWFFRLLRLLFFFRGRVPRGTYVMAVIALVAVFAALFVLIDAAYGYEATFVLYPPFFWAGAALTVKRLHDRGHSAWRLLIVLIPVLGPLWLGIALLLRAGSPGENQYGEDPRLRDAEYLIVT
jgi:uncharacterized membrane protein YhaH (DUF805 family)